MRLQSILIAAPLLMAPVAVVGCVPESTIRQEIDTLDEQIAKLEGVRDAGLATRGDMDHLDALLQERADIDVYRHVATPEGVVDTAFKLTDPTTVGGGLAALYGAWAGYRALRKRRRRRGPTVVSTPVPPAPDPPISE